MSAKSSKLHLEKNDVRFMFLANYIPFENLKQFVLLHLIRFQIDTFYVMIL